MGKVLSINIAEKRGIEKRSIDEVNVIHGWGLENDAHGGDWDRQVSVFPIEAMEKVPEDKKEEVCNSGYTENFTIEGIPLEELTAGSLLKIGEAEIEILYIGKDEFKEKGRPYIVSREGRFGKVVKGGKVRKGDPVHRIMR
jgi:MOSC domain-containing protein YiiM